MARLSDGNRRSVERLLAFYEKHPADPLRWDAAAAAAIWRGPQAGALKVATGSGSRGRAKIPGTELDQEVVHRNSDRMQELAAAIFAAPDASPNARATAELYYLRPMLSPRWASRSAGCRAAPARADRELLPATIPRGHEDRGLRGRCGLTRARTRPRPSLKRFVDSPNAPIRELVAGKIHQREMDRKRAEILRKPFELKFTSVDGREVDFARAARQGGARGFLGHVVRPVQGGAAERHRQLPEISRPRFRGCRHRARECRARAEGHTGTGGRQTGQGEKDPHSTSRRRSRCRGRSISTASGWKTDLAGSYFINLIPAMFLLDQDGKVVSTEARGPKLRD